MNVCMCICERVRIEEFAHDHKCAREVLCRCFYTYENIHVHVCSHVTVCINMCMYMWCSYVSLCMRDREQ